MSTIIVEAPSAAEEQPTTPDRVTHLGCALKKPPVLALCGWRRPDGAPVQQGEPFCLVCADLAARGHCPMCGGFHFWGGAS